MTNCTCPKVGDGPCYCNNDTVMPPWYLGGLASGSNSLVANCNRHQAPSGYKYLMQNGHCVLVQLSTGHVIPITSTAVLPSVDTQTGAVINNVKTWIGNNKGLSLALAGVALYFLTKDK